MTSEINVRGTSEALEYLEEIASEMVLLFPITIKEARGRIEREFRTRRFETTVEVGVLLHEEQDVWAKHIYFGRDSFWWSHETLPEPRPFP